MEGIAFAAVWAAFSSSGADGAAGAGFGSSDFSGPGVGGEPWAELAVKKLAAINEAIRLGIVRKGDLSWQLNRRDRL